jgi:hypothetical protein
MSTDRDTTRIVRSWLRTEEHESADRVLDAVLDQLDTTPQRRATWWPARRLPDMNTSAKLALAAAAVVVAAFLGIRFLLPGGTGVGDTPNPTAVPTATPTAMPVSAIDNDQGSEPGRYRLRPNFPVGITFDLPAGWLDCFGGPHEQGVCSSTGSPTAPDIGVAFLIVDNVVTDPCDETSLADPPVGPSVDDLVTAISSLPGFDATAPEDVVIGGFPAKRFAVTSPAGSPCGLMTWAMSNRVNGVGLNETNLLHVIDVDGVRVMVAVASFPQTPEESIAAAEAIIASIDIEP